MTGMVSTQFVSVVEPLLNEVFDGIYNKLPREYAQIFAQQQAIARRFQETAVLYGLGTAVQKPEGSQITYDQGGEHYRVRFTPKVYALAYAMSEELIDDGDHIALGKTFAEHLARGMDESKEIVHANILNRAENGSYLGGDNVTLLSASHPLALGGTYSNLLATPANLSEAAIEQLCIQIMNAVDGRNKRIALKPVKLIISPTNVFNATRILRSTLQSNTADNNVNALKTMGMLQADPVVITRLTNAQQWFIQTDAPEGLMTKQRKAMKRGMEGDFNTNSMRYKAYERYDANWVDPRCLYGTAGS